MCGSYEDEPVTEPEVEVVEPVTEPEVTEAEVTEAEVDEFIAELEEALEEVLPCRPPVEAR